jgi:hypothetical protein
MLPGSYDFVSFPHNILTLKVLTLSCPPRSCGVGMYFTVKCVGYTKCRPCLLLVMHVERAFILGVNCLKLAHYGTMMSRIMKHDPVTFLCVFFRRFCDLCQGMVMWIWGNCIQGQLLMMRQWCGIFNVFCTPCTASTFFSYTNRSETGLTLYWTDGKCLPFQNVFGCEWVILTWHHKNALRQKRITSERGCRRSATRLTPLALIAGIQACIEIASCVFWWYSSSCYRKFWSISPKCFGGARVLTGVQF